MIFRPVCDFENGFNLCCVFFLSVVYLVRLSFSLIFELVVWCLRVKKSHVSKRTRSLCTNVALKGRVYPKQINESKTEKFTTKKEKRQYLIIVLVFVRESSDFITRLITLMVFTFCGRKKNNEKLYYRIKMDRKTYKFAVLLKKDDELIKEIVRLSGLYLIF